MGAVDYIPILLSALLLALLAPHSQFKHLTSIPNASALFAATISGLALLWSLDVELVKGISVHFVMLTAATLILGLRLACIAALIALLLLAATGNVNFQQIPTLWLFQAMPSCLLSYVVLLVARKYLSHHLFIYIFINGFLVGALSLAAGYLLLTFWYWQIGQFSFDLLYQHQLKILPLMLFPEALLNGMTITLLTVYKPHWIRTFDDEDYLH